MAFTLSQSWEAGGFAPAAERARFLPPRAADRSRRAGAILLSVLVHAVLILLLLNRIAAPAAFGEAGQGPGDGPMTMLDLSDPGSPAPAPSPPQAPPAAKAPASPVDSSAAEPMLPAEWTVSRLPPSASASAAPAAGARGSGAGAGLGGGGLGGGGVYDPYAGAAPNRSGLDGAAPARSLAGQVLGFLGLEIGRVRARRSSARGGPPRGRPHPSRPVRNRRDRRPGVADRNGIGGRRARRLGRAEAPRRPRPGASRQAPVPRQCRRGSGGNAPGGSVRVEGASVPSLSVTLNSFQGPAGRALFGWRTGS